MNVTIKIDNMLVKGARHRAVDDGLSLSGWVAKLIYRELLDDSSLAKRGGLLELLGDDEPQGGAVDFPRDKSPTRKIEF